MKSVSKIQFYRRMDRIEMVSKPANLHGSKQTVNSEFLYSQFVCSNVHTSVLI